VGSVGTMEGLLNYMSGSLANVRQYLFINSPNQADWLNYSQGNSKQIFDIRMKEFSLFFKDDWKVTDNLTLNLGVRYDYYGVPYVESGMTVGLDGGPLAIFGVSGRSFGSIFSRMNRAIR
jgi:outer membrane receptor protein involved in Fe transport